MCCSRWINEIGANFVYLSYISENLYSLEQSRKVAQIRMQVKRADGMLMNIRGKGLKENEFGEKLTHKGIME